MYIKTLTIQGFKSYRDQTQIEPFSARHNVVVGRNGSGKSNFFAAIRFVLSDAYTSMSREERQSLLHEGVSVTTTLSAYVEIVFDNSDNRFPTGREEVILRRTIGLKKDEYSLDKKSASKADVMNLLESAGFSKSNPYYIVPQGRITALTNAKDHERLALMKEVAGTKVYEQRRAESLRIMQETDNKRDKINELLEFIDGRLTELEEEKEELKEYQEKDKERRCLEYAVYSRELDEVTEAVDEIEEERRGEVHNANLRREQFNDRQKQTQGLEQNMSRNRTDLTTLNLTRQGTQAELNDLIRSRTELQCTVDDLNSASERAGGKREELEAELENIIQQIEAKEQELEELRPQWEEARTQENDERRQLDAAQAQLEALYSKRGRMDKFRTKADRDRFLNREIASVQAYRGTQDAALTKARSDLRSAQESLDNIEARLKNAQDIVTDGRTRMKDLTAEISQFKDEHSTMSEERKTLWREETRLRSVVDNLNDELRTAERLLASMMDKDTGTGLRAVEEIAERHNMDGVYGPLYKLFKILDDKFNIAVELTAGTSLFHVVVDTDETASELMKTMVQERTGRVTFVPLNRIHPKVPSFAGDQDAIPLMNQLHFESIFRPALEQVFGKTYVCRDLTLASSYVKGHGINTITLDGDKVDRKGALTGGYHDVRRSRLEAITNVKDLKEKHVTATSDLRETTRKIQFLDQRITQTMGRIQVSTNKLTQAKTSRDSATEDITALMREKERHVQRIERLESDVYDLETELTGLDAKLEGYRTELASPMANGLTAQEEDTIEALGRDVEERQKRLREVARKKNELGSRKNLMEIELSENLCRRRDELKNKIEALGEAAEGDSDSAEDLEARKRELKALNTQIDSLRNKLGDMEKQVEKLTAQLNDDRTKLESFQSQQAEDSRGVSKQQKNTERYLAKRQMLLTRKDECNRNIRDLGVLPEEAFNKYTGERLDRLVKKLHAVNEGLKKFAHVNKKAFEQYTNFTKQRDQLLQRREDLDKSAESIEELVEVLDQRKDEAIERTFKQVASNFEEVFEKLVPAGRGRLIIQRRIDQDEEDAEEAEETQQSTIDNYTGVSIKVSFNSKVDEGLRIQQLSGGQKSLVALATVFAIQKCDPAPFYLFDEIDANLDAQYRTAVAGMIHDLASTAQFITTTFRPEMLAHADKFYGVLFNNQKVSSIRSIKQAEAQEFVDQEAQAQ
ncbi:Structural maintenance of chromosomes protein 3 [Steccherinum ochraceum]|uniref:Structural maintenance of chromosomes protein n=1 Tax=Steccherinum ochraceum TaxID=92696 RepID=A0A4R0REY3_9APHY|nr:Structural maintenance of chromosomes protein 3 [Steccherinum ochraceum]